jgi:pteridine reductase
MLDLMGQGAVIVGAKRVGALVARRIADEGANIAIVYRSSIAEAQTLQRDLAERTGKVTLIQADLSKEVDVERAVETAVDDLGGLRFAVNLAAGFPRTPFADLDSGAWERSMGDARGSYLLGVHAGRAMMKNDGPTRGHIVFFADWAALHAPYRDYLPYMTAKAAIDFMTRAFAVELAPSGILVNAIAPGPTMRPPDIEPASWERDVVAHAPLARESAAGEIAEMVATLLKSETITGETIRVDAGRHLAGPGK